MAQAHQGLQPMGSPQVHGVSEPMAMPQPMEPRQPMEPAFQDARWTEAVLARSPSLYLRVRGSMDSTGPRAAKNRTRSRFRRDGPTLADVGTTVD